MPAYYYPNRMGRVLLASLRQELGRDRLNEVLQAAGLPGLGTSSLLPNNLEKRFSFDAIGALQTGVEQVCGSSAGRRLNYRVGQGTFAYGLKDFDPVIGISDLPLRLIPLGMKFRVGLDVFARVFNQFSDQIVRVSDSDTHYLWIIERCPVCWGRRTEAACCQLAAGLLDEAARWASGGLRFTVEETACKARGDENCVITIAKTPLDQTTPPREQPNA